jgi:indolepyruvate ferredoxin oxidoreductase beta subunit
MAVTSIMIVGVGGQGTLLASKILGSVAVTQGYDVKMSEVHGMAQRGGSVVTYVRYGEKVHSPIISPGEADIVLAFEELEAMRWASFCQKGGTLIVNTQRIDPMPVVTGAKKYPSETVEQLSKSEDIRLIPVDALSLAKEAGTVKAVNVVLIGVLAKSSGIDKDVWIQAVKDNVPERFRDMNIKAFELGYNA